VDIFNNDTSITVNIPCRPVKTHLSRICGHFLNGGVVVAD